MQSLAEAVRIQRSEQAGLTHREVEVLSLIADGLTNAEIAARLFVSVRTVHAHLRSLYAKLGARSRTTALRRASELGVVLSPP